MFFRSPNSEKNSSNPAHWKPYDMAHQHYLSINTNHAVLKSHLRAEKVAFWNYLVPQLVKKIASRQDSGIDYFSYKIFMWLVFIVAAILAVIAAFLSVILLSVSKRRDQLEITVAKNNIPAVVNCNSNSHSAPKPQMV